MKTYLIILILFVTSCNNHSSNSNNSSNVPNNDTLNSSIHHDDKYKDTDSEVYPESLDTFVLGDIDHNKSQDTAVINVFNSKNQTVNINFSSGLPTLTHANGFGGYLIVLEDFDADGNNEILYFPDWFSSNWAGYFIYTLKNKKWQLMAEGTCTRNAVSEANSSSVFLKSRVKKIHANTIQLIDHEMGEDGNIDEVKREVKF